MTYDRFCLKRVRMQKKLFVVSGCSFATERFNIAVYDFDAMKSILYVGCSL